MSPVEFIFANKRVSYTLLFLLCLLGVLSYLNLPKAEDPGFTIRSAVVTTRLPGASAQRVEELVSSVIEEKIMEMPELDNVTSTSRNGVSIVTANFKEIYTEMRPIFDRLRRKVEVAESDLPEGVIGPDVDDEFGDTFGTVYTLASEGFSYPELKKAAENIRQTLLTLPDVAKVELQGVRNEAIYIEYSNARLRELRVTTGQLISAIQNTNIIQSGGRMLLGDERISLEPSGDFDDVQALRKTVLSNQVGDLLQLQDLAEISRVLDDPPSELVSARGENAIAISMSMRSGGDILVMGKQVEALMAEIQQQLPLGLELRKTAFQSDTVNASINDFLINILQAVGIVGSVLLLFLGLRTGLIVAASIPIIMAITFAAMSWLDLSIDRISLSGLIIALGLLVDNGIVMSEAIQLRLQRGMARQQAAIQTAREMGIPLLVGSATTIAAFSPIAFAESAIGEFCAAIFYVVAIALLISWLMGMTIIPVTTSQLLAVGNPDDRQAREGILKRLYRSLVTLTIRFRWLILLLAGLMLYSITYAFSNIRQEFIPPSNEPLVTVELDLPQGVDISVTRRLSESLDQFLSSAAAESAGVMNWTSFIGISAPRFKLGYNPGNTDAAHLTTLVNVTGGDALDEVITLLSGHIAQSYPDAQYKVDRLSQGPPVAYPIQLRISGRSIEKLETLTGELKQALWSTPGVLEVIDNWGIRSKKLLVDIDPDRANAAGISNIDVANSLSTGLSGVTVSELREGEDRIPVVLRSLNTDRHDIRRLTDLTINSSRTGATVPLGQVAELAVAWEVPKIIRRDLTRTITVSATLKSGYSATDVNQTLQPWFSAWESALEPGYRVEQGGEAESSDQATASIVDKLPIAILVIVLLLVGQFNSFRRMAIVMATIPLGLIGMAWGLYVTDVAFGFFTILGIISLAGIIINNAIILIDRIDIEQRNGRALREAIVEAAVQRARPILLTTATTCGGMVPLWLGGDMFETMAVTLFFGMIIGTLITLFVVPALFSLLFGFGRDSGAEIQTDRDNGNPDSLDKPAAATMAGP